VARLEQEIAEEEVEGEISAVAGIVRLAFDMIAASVFDTAEPAAAVDVPHTEGSVVIADAQEAGSRHSER
jgi:hypothetical protein